MTERRRTPEEKAAPFDYAELVQQLLFTFFLGYAVAGRLGAPAAMLAVLVGQRLRSPALVPGAANTREIALVVGLAVAGIATHSRSAFAATSLGLVALALGGRLCVATVNRPSVQIGLLVVVGLADGGADGSLIRSVDPDDRALWHAALVFCLGFATSYLPMRIGADHVLEPPTLRDGRRLDLRTPGTPLVFAPLLAVLVVGSIVASSFITDAAPTLDRSGLDIDFGLGDGSGAPRRDHPGLDGVLDAADNPPLSDAEVLRVRSDVEMYWRGMTYNAYDGRYWYDTLDRDSFSFPGGGTILTYDPAPSTSVEVVQTFRLVDMGLDVLLTTPRADTVYFEGFTGTYSALDEVVLPDRRLEAGASWTVVSSVPVVSDDDLRAAGPIGAELPPTIESVYAHEEDLSVETATLAASITAEADTLYDAVTAIEDWFDDNVRYDRWDAAVPDGTDPVDHLLFETRRGYCEQIASAMTVMLRSLGVAARVVVGYVPGDYDAETGEWVSLGTDAHAWTEVYFPGVGWQAFDPTSGVPLTADAVADADADGGAGLDLPGGDLAPVVPVVVVLVGTVLALRRRGRASPPPPLHARVEALGPRLGLDWTAPGTLRDRLDDLARAGVDPALVAETRTVVEHHLYGIAPDAPEGERAVAATRADELLDRLDAAVEARRQELVTT